MLRVVIPASLAHTICKQCICLLYVWSFGGKCIIMYTQICHASYAALWAVWKYLKKHIYHIVRETLPSSLTPYFVGLWIAVQIAPSIHHRTCTRWAPRPSLPPAAKPAGRTAFSKAWEVINSCGVQPHKMGRGIPSPWKKIDEMKIPNLWEKTCSKLYKNDSIDLVDRIDSIGW